MTTISGTVTISSSVSGKARQKNSLAGADVFLFDADKPEWLYPVAEAKTGTSGDYKVDKRANGNLNKNPDGSTAYADGSGIPTGNYTVIADNYYNFAYGQDTTHYVAVQPHTKKFDGDAAGNDLTAYDSDAVPFVLSMFGLPENGDGSFGGVTTELARNMGIQITFSMAMSRLSVLKAINIKDGQGSPVQGAWKVSADLLSATFYPTSPLTVGQTYTVKVAGNAKNVYGKNLPKESNGSFKVKAGDTTPPNATLYSPSAQEGVAINTSIEIAANELLDINTIKVASTPSIGDRPNVLYIGSTGTIPGKPYVYEIVPSGLLKLNTDYAITVSGAKDMAGNALTAFTFNFKTASSTTAPSVQSTTPSNNATGVSLYSAISAVFTSQMDASTINAQTFTARGASAVNGSVNYNPLTRTAVFTPSSSLAQSTTYTATITTGAKDTGGTPMAANYTWSFKTGTTLDTSAPTTPTGLVANAVSSSQINLSWNASTDNVGVTGYRVYRNGTYADITVRTGTATSDMGLAANTQYCYQVSAIDAAGNESAKSGEACGRTHAAADASAPTAPTGLVANAVSSSRIDLSWTASTDNIGVTGYRVYRGGTAIANATTTSYGDAELSADTQYCYQVAALDAAGNESAKSGEACGRTIKLFKLPDTGQTTSYTTTFGEDADYTINPPSYTDNGNGTITDNVTGLIWQKEDDNVTRTWAEAGTYCDGLSLGGQTDWRLPNEFELISIVDYGATNPTIDASYFPNTNASDYWSSTTFAYNTSFAWFVNFLTGNVLHNYDKSNYYYVRCVRGNIYPSQSYADNGNGTVTENNTGLIWQKEDDNVARTWEQALTYCEGFSLAGYTDWRLPNVKELELITDDTKFNPAIDTTYFPSTNASYYWSSTTNDSAPLAAWYVLFDDGYVGGIAKSVNYYVRCVRAGQ